MPDCTFRDDLGRAVPAVTASEMLRIDRIAIDETGPNLYQMMENAARGLATAALEMLGERRPQAVTILAGTGGNGGGGIAAGRHLLNHGVTEVTLGITDADRMIEVAAMQLELFRHAGGKVQRRVPEVAARSSDLVVDAIIGYSLTGAPRGVVLDMIEWVNAAAAPVLSLDVPSGIDATTGEAPGAAISATRTVTLALPKHGLCAPQAGELTLADIGIPAEVYRRAGHRAAASVFDARYLLPLHRNLSHHE